MKKKTGKDNPDNVKNENKAGTDSAESLTAALKRIPDRVLNIAAVIPAFLFLTAYLRGFMNAFVGSDAYMTGRSKPFNSACEDIRPAGLIISFLVIAVYLIKNSPQKGSVKRFIKEHTYLLFFGIFYLLILISPLIHGITDYVTHGDVYRHEDLLTVLCYPLVYMLPLTIVRSEGARKAVVYSFLLFGMATAAATIIKYYGYGLQNYGMPGIFRQFNHYGYFLTVMISAAGVLMLTEEKLLLKTIAFISFITNSAVLVLNHTFGAELSTLFALILAAVMLSLRGGKFRGWYIMPLILYLTVMGAMSFGTESPLANFLKFGSDLTAVASGSATGKEGTGRLEMWRFAIDKIKGKPLFGHGMEGITHEMETCGKFDANRPHNEFLQYAAFYGIPASAAYAVGCLMAFIRGLRLRKDLDGVQVCAFAAAFAYLVSSFVGNSMYYTTPLLYIFLGMAGSAKAKVKTVINE